MCCSIFELSFDLPFQERKLKMKAQMKIESAKLLMESLQNMPLQVKSETNEQASTVKLFSEFMDKVCC